MQYSGLYRCSGCSFTFSDPAAWRERRMCPRVPNADSEAMPLMDREVSSAGTAESAGVERTPFGLR